tara:strand:+ start:99 stop:566 length:468 start_codon:yes stop_codon:yes gene_type:complete
MIKKIAYGIVLLISVVLAFFILWLASASSANAQAPIICDNGITILQKLHTKFGEIPTERGQDEEVFVVISVSPLHKWTMVASPKGHPDMFCVVATGHSWTQEETSSTGIIHDESILIISFKKNGTWSMVFIDSTKKIHEVTTTGSNWERTITLKN